MFKKSTMACVKFKFKARLPCTIMRPKNKYLKKQKEIPTEEEVELYLDPTINNQLYNDIFEKLKKKIKVQNQK